MIQYKNNLNISELKNFIAKLELINLTVLISIFMKRVAGLDIYKDILHSV